MNLKDKPCYPTIMDTFDYGLTFRERLIIALASNPNLVKDTTVGQTTDMGYKMYRTKKQNAEHVVSQADAIIKEMEIGG